MVNGVMNDSATWAENVDHMVKGQGCRVWCSWLWTHDRKLEHVVNGVMHDSTTWKENVDHRVKG